MEINDNEYKTPKNFDKQKEKEDDSFANIYEEENEFLVVHTTNNEDERSQINKLASKYNGKFNKKKKGWYISKKVFDEFEKELKELMDVHEHLYSSDESENENESSQDEEERRVQESLKQYKEERKNRKNERKRIEGYDIEDSDQEDIISTNRKMRWILDKIKVLEDKVAKLELKNNS